MSSHPDDERPHPGIDRDADETLDQTLADDTPESPDDFAERMSIREMVEQYAASAPLRLNPDTSVVDRVVAGLEAREKKTGLRLCPCRIAKKDPVENQKIVCPCIYHLEEIERDGHCHCHLFVRR